MNALAAVAPAVRHRTVTDAARNLTESVLIGRGSRWSRRHSVGGRAVPIQGDGALRLPPLWTVPIP